VKALVVIETAGFLPIHHWFAHFINAFWS